MRGVKNNLLGRRFGLLTVYAEAGRSRWQCRCDCGETCIKEGHELLRKGDRAWTHSCGCRAALSVSIGKLVGNPGRIVGHPERRHHRAIIRPQSKRR